METKNKPSNPPAFPVTQDTALAAASGSKGITGMRLRDYFAAKAINGVIAHLGHVDGAGDHEFIAEHSYRIADAMLTAREK